MGCFVASVGALMAVVYRYYPDKVSESVGDVDSGKGEVVVDEC